MPETLVKFLQKPAEGDYGLRINVLRGQIVSYLVRITRLNGIIETKQPITSTPDAVHFVIPGNQNPLKMCDVDIIVNQIDHPLGKPLVMYSWDENRPESQESTDEDKFPCKFTAVFHFLQ